MPTCTGEHTYEREVSRPMRRTGPNGSQYDVTDDKYNEQHHDDANTTAPHPMSTSLEAHQLRGTIGQNIRKFMGYRRFRRPL